MLKRFRWYTALCLGLLSLFLLGSDSGPLAYTAEKLLDCKSLGCEIAPPMSVPGGILFFVHNVTPSSDSSNQYLWFSDGTVKGTNKLLDLCWGIDSTYSLMYPYDGTSILVDERLFFFAPYATDAGCAWGLWRFDSSDQTVVKIRDHSIGRLAFINNQVLLFEGPYYGLENSLWVINETYDGTELIRQFDGTISGIIPWGDRIVLAVKIGEGASRQGEIWSTNGTVEETKLLATKIYRYCEISPKAYSVLNGSLLFICYDSEADFYELWKTDGAESGTVSVADLNYGVTNGLAGIGSLEMASANGQAFFNGWHTLYQTDGTAAGTKQVYAVNMNSKPYNYISWFIPYKGALYFYGEPLGYGSLYKTYGRKEGEDEGQIIPISSAETDTAPYCWEPIILLNDRLYFQRDYPGYDYRLTDSWYWTDGTNVNFLSAPADDYQNPCDLTLFEGRLFFSAYDKGDNQTNLNNELWVDDGITTHRVVDLDEGYSFIKNLTVSDEYLFFINRFWDEPITRDELWVYAPLTQKIFLPSVRR